MFSKKQSSWDSLPPTRECLKPVIQRAHFQAMIWKRCVISQQRLPSPCDYGWTIKENAFFPAYGNLVSVPENVLDLISCSCTKGHCRPPCKCAQNKMTCSEMCLCGGDEEKCQNSSKEEELDDTDDFYESDED